MVAQLTETQKNLLIGNEFSIDEKFNPCQDANGVWYISTESVERCTNENFAWVKELPLINYVPKVV